MLVNWINFEAQGRGIMGRNPNVNRELWFGLFLVAVFLGLVVKASIRSDSDDATKAETAVEDSRFDDGDKARAGAQFIEDYPQEGGFSDQGPEYLAQRPTSHPGISSEFDVFRQVVRESAEEASSQDEAERALNPSDSSPDQSHKSRD